MKVLLCAIHSKYIHSALAPWCLAAGIRDYAKEPFAYEVVEGTVNQTDEALLSALLRPEADVFALSCYIWNISCIRRLLPVLKQERPGCKVILGGPEVSFCPEQVLNECPQVDYILAGEGRGPFRPCWTVCLWDRFQSPFRALPFGGKSGYR